MDGGVNDDSRRVLIVDDDEAIAGALHSHLVDAGVAVDVVSEPSLAEELLRSRRYAVVVADAYMTGQLHERAVTFVDRVMSLRGNAHLVLVSAYGSSDFIDHILAAGSTTIVRKPTSIPLLAELVEGFLIATGDTFATKGSHE